MKIQYKISLLLILLIATMFFWIDKTHDIFLRIISSVMTAVFAYLLGMANAKRIESNHVHQLNDD